MSLVIKLPRTSKPVQQARVLSGSLLGNVLDHAWLCNSTVSIDTVGNIQLPNYVPFSLQSTSLGIALASDGSSSVQTSATAAITTYPYIQIGYGIFNNSTSNWSFSSLASTSGGYSVQLRIIAGNTVGAYVRYNYGSTPQEIGITLASSTNTPICIILQAFSDTDHRIYVNGQMATSTSSAGVLSSAAGLNLVHNLTANFNGKLYFSGYGQGRALTDSQAVELSKNPEKIWGCYTPIDVPIFVSLATLITSITLVSATSISSSTTTSAIINTGVFPALDDSLSGWTGVPDNTNVYSNVNEVSRSDTEYMQSPAITGSQGAAIYLLNNSLAAGVWEIDMASKYTVASAQIKYTLLNSSNVSVGDTGWISLTNSFADYSPTITTTGISTKIKVEVQ